MLTSVTKAGGDLNNLNQILMDLRYTNDTEIADTSLVLLNITLRATNYQICNTNETEVPLDIFKLSQLKYNHKPSVKVAIPTQTIKVKAFSIISLTDYFEDLDSDSITYKVEIQGGTVTANDSTLYDWTIFDNTKQELILEPDYADSGEFTVTVTATDEYNANI